MEEDEYQYFYFMTNTELPSEKVVITYEKCGNSIDAAGLQYVFVVQDRPCKWNGIPAANKDVQIEIYLPGWEDYANCQKRDHEAFRKISLSRDL